MNQSWIKQYNGMSYVLWTCLMWKILGAVIQWREFWTYRKHWCVLQFYIKDDNTLIAQSMRMKFIPTFGKESNKTKLTYLSHQFLSTFILSSTNSPTFSLPMLIFSPPFLSPTPFFVCGQGPQKKQMAVVKLDFHRGIFPAVFRPSTPGGAQRQGPHFS